MGGRFARDFWLLIVSFWLRKMSVTGVVRDELVGAQPVCDFFLCFVNFGGCMYHIWYTALCRAGVAVCHMRVITANSAGLSALGFGRTNHFAHQGNGFDAL